MFTRATLNIPASDLLAVPAQRPHPPLPIHGIVSISFWQFPHDQNILEPAFVPLADRLRSTAIKFQRHHSIAQDAFSPSTGAFATLCDISANRSLFAVGCDFDVSLGRRWKLEEELFGSEFQGHEARDGNVRGDLLDDFGGQCCQVYCA